MHRVGTVEIPEQAIIQKVMADGAAGFNLFHFGSHSGAELFNVIKTDHIFQNDDAVALQGRESFLQMDIIKGLGLFFLFVWFYADRIASSW